MDQASLKEILAGLPLGPVLYYERTSSTNDEAGRWVENGAPDLALVVADEQTAGRGRLGRSWHTPPASALAFTLVLKNAPQEEILPYTALGALAVSAALGKHFALRPQIKWPNDVLVDGRKLAGVLVEAYWRGEQLQALVLGIGINVAPESVPPEADLQFPATSVETSLSRPVDRWVLLKQVLQALLDWRPLVGEPEFIQAWEDQLAFRGEWVRVSGAGSEPTGLPERGRVDGLNPDGTLRLRTADGKVHTIRSGDIRVRPVDNLQE
jgi:BirA family transcriptional regulator, biotin operon repressor / biotin---[acetyl-CoA-carboxylase] ligase